ncbi:hypothetical protein ACX0E7_13995, partial [Enterococcus faecium]
KNIFESHELDEGVVCSILERTTEHGAVSGFAQTQAEQKAFAEYEKFNKQQLIESDFDRVVKKFLQKKDAKE